MDVMHLFFLNNFTPLIAMQFLLPSHIAQKSNRVKYDNRKCRSYNNINFKLQHYFVCPSDCP